MVHQLQNEQGTPVSDWEPVIAYFDSSDSQYLANHFTVAYLRKEIMRFETMAATQDAFMGTPYELEDIFPYKDYIETCRNAIKIIQSAPAHQFNKKLANFVMRGKDVDTLKANFDMYSVALKYTALKKAGRNYRGLCPLHQERNPSFFVYPEQNRWYCFSCNKGGDIFSLIMAAENTDFKGAVQRLTR